MNRDSMGVKCDRKWGNGERIEMGRLAKVEKVT